MLRLCFELLHQFTTFCITIQSLLSWIGVQGHIQKCLGGDGSGENPQWGPGTGPLVGVWDETPSPES